MRVLLDENLPAAMAELLAGHEVVHVDELGMKSIRNGELLKFARSNFDALITLDRGILYQHDHRHHSLIVLVPRVANSRKETIFAKGLAIAEALDQSVSGTATEL